MSHGVQGADAGAYLTLCFLDDLQQLVRCSLITGVCGIGVNSFEIIDRVKDSLSFILSFARLF